jgi:hypothetical protein
VDTAYDGRWGLGVVKPVGELSHVASTSSVSLRSAAFTVSSAGVLCYLVDTTGLIYLFTVVT